MSDDRAAEQKNNAKAERLAAYCAMRRWEMHPAAMHVLIINALLQAVDDASRVAQGRPLDGGKHTDREIFADKLADWTEDSRFEFWTEYTNIDCESARNALNQITEGKRGVDCRTYKRGDR